MHERSRALSARSIVGINTRVEPYSRSASRPHVLNPDSQPTQLTPEYPSASAGVADRSIPDIIVRGLEALVRGAPNALDAYLHGLHREVQMEGAPKVGLHCHVLQVDGNGRPRLHDLIEFVCRSTLEYAIPRSRIIEAEAYRERHNSWTRMVKLTREADDLFTTLVQSGEGGELLLFCIAEQLLRLPQVLCKMDLKTSNEMHYHGADGVHCGVDAETGTLAVYWAESKIYKNATRAITDCLESLAKLLRDPGGGDAARDFQLLQRYMDVANPELEEALRKYLDKDDPAYLQLQFRGLCLVGFDSDAYGDAEQRCQPEVMREATAALVPEWRAHIATRVGAERLTEFNIEMVCVPFPDARAFRRRFREALNMPPEPVDPDNVEGQKNGGDDASSGTGTGASGTRRPGGARRRGRARRGDGEAAP